MVDKIRMEILKKQSRRKNLIKELINYLNISECSFLDEYENKDFCMKVFEKLETLTNKIEIGNENYKVNIDLSKHFLVNRLSGFICKKKQVRLLFYRKHEIEAISVDLNEVIMQLDKVLDISNFTSGYGDFILVGENLEFGICIERTEYCYEYSEWGIDNF